MKTIKTISLFKYIMVLVLFSACGVKGRPEPPLRPQVPAQVEPKIESPPIETQIPPKVKKKKQNGK